MNYNVVSAQSKGGRRNHRVITQIENDIAPLNLVMRELSLDLAESNYMVDIFGHVPGT